MGPLSIKKDKMFGGITYLTATSDYTFSNFKGTGDSLKFKRNDLDLIAGYMFHPRFGAFVGYKSLSADVSYSWPVNSLGTPITGSGTRTLTGPGVGITGNYPFEALPLSLYGNLSMMSLKDKFDFTTKAAGYQDSTSSSSTDLSGASVELGASYSFSNNISANLGIKSQSFTGSDKGTTTTETFSGLTFGANYTF